MNAREVVNSDWTFTRNESGSLTFEAISCAATLDSAHTLLRIEQLMRSLGADGLHTLIKLAAKTARRRERARVKRRAK